MNRKLRVATILSLFISVPILVGLSLSIINDTSSYEIEHEGRKIKNSIYAIYQNKVYALVPSNGYYSMDNADSESFKLLPDRTFTERQFSMDKNYAYCGNTVIPEFKPNTAKSLGNNYFTDGESIVYCASFSIRNHDLSIFNELFQAMLYGLKLADKPQTYLYPMKLLPKSTTPYRALLDASFITDGKSVFYDGEYMQNANPNTLQRVGEYGTYSRDDKNVYYEQYKLPLESNSELYTLNLNGRGEGQYLIDPKSGNVAIGNIVFPLEYAPYKIISQNRAHINQALFLSKDGIFFYDIKKNTIKRAGDNPFIGGELKEIAPLVFTYKNQTYFVQDFEHRSSSRRLGLRSFTISTRIYRLDDKSSKPWEIVSDLANSRFGSVWKKGNEYYYFDNLGSSQFIRRTIYQIDSMDTVKHLLSTNISISDIRKLVDHKNLIPVKATEIIEATTKIH